MLNLTTPQREALAGRHVKRRLFIWVESRTPEGDPDPVGFYDDVGDIIYLGRTYHGSGNVIEVGTVSARSDMSVPVMVLTLSGVEEAALVLVKGTVIEQAPITVQVGLFNPTTRQIIPPLLPHFKGFVDNARITTPEVGGESRMEITCESRSRALTQGRTDTRSDASSRIRDPADTFYADTAVQRTKPTYFGAKAPTG